MSASTCIGRVGGLAVALGVGAAVFSSMGVAAADTDSPDATNASSVSTRRSPVAVKAVRPANRHSAAANASVPESAAKPLSAAALNTDIPQRRLSALSRRVTAAGGGRPAASSAAPGTDVSGTGVAVTDVSGTGVAVTDVSAAWAAATTTSRTGTLPATPRTAAVASALSSVQDPNALAPRFSPRVLGVSAISTTASLVGALLQQLAIAIQIGPTRTAFNQTLTLNGYSLVPESTELMTSFFGPWTYAPGGLNIRQGQQQYKVVDPGTQETLGTFDALVSSGIPLGLGAYTELIVTSTDGVVGDGAGAIPPYGSVIAEMDIIGEFGWVYSAIPSLSGNVVSFALTTPFGNIPIRFYNFDAAKGIADHTVDNRPIDLGNGYSIAPSDPAGETYTGTTGLLPLYQTLNVSQRYDIRDSSGTPVGTFDGVAQSTADGLGIYTEALMVTKSYGDNIGTNPGQVPPPGTVYNVAYLRSDADWGLYTSMPSASGDVISMLETGKKTVSNVLTWPVNRLDASAPPAVKRLPFAGGYGILPISPVDIYAVGGLPPRDVQVQGYQQFAVYDPEGVQTGTFNAMVTNQWDLLGINSQAILVTKVTDGTAGTAAGDVPTVGSVLNYVYFGDSGFGTSYWSLPSPSGTKTSYKILTPIIDIPTWSTYNASKDLDKVTLVNPLDV